MVAGNQASPSSRGESVCCCAARPCRLATTAAAAATTATASRENQQIWNLPAVMNGGLLQRRLPPQPQMDDCGQLKCFLRHRCRPPYSRQSGNRRRSRSFHSPLLPLSDVWGRPHNWREPREQRGSPSRRQIFRQMKTSNRFLGVFCLFFFPPQQKTSWPQMQLQLMLDTT